ncbi:MAG: PilZ domain-containing protein [Myxococcota bacterium]
MSPDSYREKRIATRLPADVRCWVGDGGVERYARVADVSEFGVRIETAAPPPVGASLSVRFKLPPLGQTVEATAEVRWRSMGHRGRAGAMGLSFTSVLGREAIEAYSRELDGGESQPEE